MLRLRATLTSNAVLRLRHEVLVARRNGTVAFKTVGQTFSIHPSHGVMAAASLTTGRALFSSTAPVLALNRQSPSTTITTTASPVGGVHGMLRSASLSARTATTSAGAYAYLFWSGQRGMHTRGKEKKGSSASGEEEEKAQAEKEAETNEEESKNKAEGEGEKTSEEEEANGDKKQNGGKKKKKAQPKKGRSIKDNYKAFREDIGKFPDIYNSANAVNFVVFTVFCLCSTGSNMEEQWWLKEWGLDNMFRPWNWLLHTFLTNNFLSMTYAMMLLHTLCHMVLPSMGSKGLFSYFAAVAIISGAIMWAGNRLYYGAGQAPEKQFGPWDAVSALFVLAYLMYGVSPVAVLNSFNSWIKYACWVGEICILYFDWQPTLVGAVVGVALCKTHPALRALIAKGGLK